MSADKQSLDNSAVRRVLVYRLGSLGDTLVALPCFKRIAEVFPHAQRLMLTNLPVHAKAPAAAGILQNTGLVDGYIFYPVGLRNPFKLLRLLLQIRSYAPDIVVYLMPLRAASNAARDLKFFRLCGVRRVLCVPDAAHQKHSLNAATGLYQSEAQRLAETLAAIGMPDLKNAAAWDLQLTVQERAKALELAQEARNAEGGFIVCGPGTKMQAKDWGVENWRNLLGKIAEEHPQMGLVLVGAKEDGEAAEQAAQDWRGARANLCGKLTPRETAAAIEGARLFLGPDSGPMHLAAAVQVPTVIAFSARGWPGVWFPAGEQHVIIYKYVTCRGCQLETCVEQARVCLSSITVDEMLCAARRVLSR